MESSSNVGAEKSTKNIQIQEFIVTIHNYLNSRTESDAIIIKKCLQCYSVRIDVNIFDPDENLGAQFYISLYQLMTNLEPHSELSWNCVELLSNISRNCSARSALIETYQFIVPLSRLIINQLSSAKKIALLKLMQDLTCGIKISWQFPQLSYLLKTLTKWVESDNKEIVCLSLGVLVNLCYKNLPAIYTLSRTVDIKKFLRYCLPLQGPLVEVHVCKLMIIIDNTQDEIPRKTLLNLIEPTFLSIVDSLTKNDPVVLRIVIDFFLNVLTKENIEFFREYKKYDEQITRIIQLITARSNNKDHNSTPMLQPDSECLNLILKLIYILETKNIGNLTNLHANIVQVGLDWMHLEKVSHQALVLLTVIAQNASKSEAENRDKDILKLLSSKLQIFVSMLQTNSAPTNIDSCRRLESILELLRTLLKSLNTSAELSQHLDEAIMQQVFDPVLEGGAISLPKLNFGTDSTISTAALNAYIQALALTNELAHHDAKWLEFLCMLMENRSIHLIIAQALYGSCSSIKQLIFEICKYPRFPMEKVATAMETSQSLFFVSKNSNQDEKIDYPIMTVAQTELLDGILDNFKRTIADKEPSDVPCKDLMDLYEYKITSMAHAERYALLNVEAASQRCIHLQHRLAQLTSELNQLRQLLHRSENCSEQTKKRMREEQEMYKVKRRKADSEIEKREKVIADLETKLISTKEELANMTELKKSLEEQNAKKEQIIQKLQENGNKMEKQLQKREEQIKNANLHIDSLNMQNQDLKKHLDQKEIKLAEITKLYNNSKDIIATITKVANQLP